VTVRADATVNFFALAAVPQAGGCRQFLSLVGSEALRGEGAICVERAPTLVVVLVAGGTNTVVPESAERFAKAAQKGWAGLQSEALLALVDAIPDDDFAAPILLLLEPTLQAESSHALVGFGIHTLGLRV